MQRRQTYRLIDKVYTAYSEEKHSTLPGCW